MISGRTKRAAVLVVALALAGAACGGDDDSGSAPTTSVDDVSDPSSTDEGSDDIASEESSTAATDPATTVAATEPSSEESSVDDDGVRQVPDEYATIQEAVDAAAEGDLILIAPGVYSEAVDVVTNELTIRGLDRDTVVLDGQLELDNGIRVLGASGVAVENLTAQNYTANGVFFTGATGYRASFITTYRTGDYGIYAFDSVTGQIDNSHTVGSKDAGVYIGQCFPCDAVIDNVISEHNGLGYSGTNSGGDLLIRSATTAPGSCPTRAATSCATRSARRRSSATSCTRTTSPTRRRSTSPCWRRATGY
jgi:hypothetical protein